MSSTDFDAVFGPVLAANATYATRQAWRKAHGFPGPVDRWLTANIRSSRIAFLKDYLMLCDIDGSDCVVCSVTSVCVNMPPNRDHFHQPDIWTLYITATAPPRHHSGLEPSVSPCAILERFVGSNKAINAPEWTQWAQKTEQFQQPRASFGVLFTRLALCDENREQPEVAYSMVKWANSIAVPAPTLLLKLQPQTPLSSPKHV
ncbi:hypothetical protein HWV62_24348 [Athelia sp. TMB]|nr:hypothetical protein HWV62_24348 [Athelia sp. TMB]